jgi:hypothetical protein
MSENYVACTVPGAIQSLGVGEKDAEQSGEQTHGGDGHEGGDRWLGSHRGRLLAAGAVRGTPTTQETHTS